MSDKVPSTLAVDKPEADNEDYVKIDVTKIKLLDCRVLCKEVDYGNVSAGGILLPPTAKKDRVLTIMKVVSVGDGRTTDHGHHIKVRVSPGDYVIVGKYAGHEVAKGFKILNEVEIFGVQNVTKE